MKETDDILKFWFDDNGFEQWFQKDDDFDAAITTRFLEVWAYYQPLNIFDYIKTPRDGLAMIILFDQFPRNMFRGSAKSFSTDTLALKIADALRGHAWDQELTDQQRTFAYMPYMHSERMSDQILSVKLFKGTASDEYAVEHHRLIEKYGRFPHRNDVLGRISTKAEQEYLSQPDAGF